MTIDPNPIDHGIMSPFEAARVEQWCEIMHDAYELAAVGAGWETNPASRKPWADVPEANKVTMRAAVRAVIAHSDGELRNFPLRYVVGIDAVRLDEPVPFVIVDEPIGEPVRAFPLDEGDTGEALLTTEPCLDTNCDAFYHQAAGPRVVFAHRLAEAGQGLDPLRALRDTIVFSSADWGAARDLAWIYGIVVGWDADPDADPDEREGDAMAELAVRHGWTVASVTRLRALHDAFVELAGGVLP